MIRRWLALTYYLYALRLAALSHFYFNPLYMVSGCLYSQTQKRTDNNLSFFQAARYWAGCAAEAAAEAGCGAGAAVLEAALANHF